MGFADYFANVYLKDHLTDLAGDIVGVAFTLLGPGAIAFLGGENNIFEAAVTYAVTTIGEDGGQLVSDLSSQNYANAGADVVNIALDVVGNIFHNLSAGQLIEFALITSGVDIGTGGGAEAYDAVGAAVTAGISVASFLGQAVLDWQTYQNS